MYILTYSDGEVTSHEVTMYETGDRYISTNGIGQVRKIDIGRIFRQANRYYVYSLSGDEIEFKAAIQAALTKRGLAHYHKWRELMQEADNIL